MDKLRGLVALEMIAALHKLATAPAGAVLIWAIAAASQAPAASFYARPAPHLRIHQRAAVDGKDTGNLQGYSPAAKRVLAQARAASGGAGWSYLRGWHEIGHQGGGTYESWFDTLRYGMRVETGNAAGLSVRGFNGQGAWRIEPNGIASGVEERAMVAQARTEAFLGAYGFFYSGRFDAHGESLGLHQLRGRSFDVITVHPWDGTPRELWFDGSSHLLARIVDRSGPLAVTMEFSDYRKVGPIKAAFHITIEGAAGGAEDIKVERIVFTNAEREMFSLPRPGAPEKP